MSKGRINAERTVHGCFQSGAHSYEGLLESPSVQLLNQTFTPTSKAGYLYQFKHFLDLNNLTPESLLNLNDKEIQQAVMKAVAHKQAEKSYAAARRMFYVARRFLELNGRELIFNKTQRKLLLKREPKKISREHVPTREEIYRMADSFPDKGPIQKARGKALILCLWQSGVRANCLCSWTYGIFKNQLYPEPKVIVSIKVVANRESGVYDCAVDAKLSAYSVNYYYTFLAKEAVEALREYLEERKKEGWTPKDSDPVFVTYGTVKESNGKPLNPQHVIEIVKNAASQIDIPRESTWTHLLRKAFRKTLYGSGVDPDVAEALMGHKLGASKTSYFDYHDVEFVKKEYAKGNWMRISIAKIEAMEEEITELRKLNEKVAKLEKEIMERDIFEDATLETTKEAQKRIKNGTFGDFDYQKHIEETIEAERQKRKALEPKNIAWEEYISRIPEYRELHEAAIQAKTHEEQRIAVKRLEPYIQRFEAMWQVDQKKKLGSKS
jgi:integrase